MTEMSLQGKVAVVTGAETETGVAVAVELARSGAAVAVQYFSSFGRAKDVVRGIEEFGGTAVAIKADLLDRAQTELMCAKAAGAFGDVDLMVVTDAVPAPDGDLGAHQLADAVRTQLLAALAPLHAVAPGMAERGSGALVYVPGADGPAAAGARALARPAIEAGLADLRRRYPASPLVCQVVPAGTRDLAAAVARLALTPATAA